MACRRRWGKYFFPRHCVKYKYPIIHSVNLNSIYSFDVTTISYILSRLPWTFFDLCVHIILNSAWTPKNYDRNHCSIIPFVVLSPSHLSPVFLSHSLSLSVPSPFFFLYPSNGAVDFLERDRIWLILTVPISSFATDTTKPQFHKLFRPRIRKVLFETAWGMMSAEWNAAMPTEA